MTTSHFSYQSFQQEPPIEDIIKYIESDDKQNKKKKLVLECESEEEEEQTENGPKKKPKRRRKNRKRNKNKEESEEEKVVNLEFDDGSTQCISKLSDQEFDKNINLFAQRLERIKAGQKKLIPNLKIGWIEKI